MKNDNDDLDSRVMNQKLQSSTFPDDEFLDSDIRIFFDRLLERMSMKKSDVIRNANIARTYGYQIFDGTRIADRDYYLRIAIAMKLDLRTVQRMLAVTRTGGLHSLIKRDAAIIFAINNGYDNIKTYDFLLRLGLPALEKDEGDNTEDD